MAKILEFTGLTCAPIPPDKVLNAAVGQLTDCLIIGYDKDNKLYIASSESNLKDILWLLETAKMHLLSN